MENDINFTINYTKAKINNTILKKHTIIFIIFIITVVSLININLINEFKDINSWDLCFYVFENKYFYTFIYLGWFLRYLIIIYDEKGLNTFIITRFNNKVEWINSKLLSVLLLSIIYSVFYFIIILLISIVSAPYEKSWSQEVMNPNTILFHFHHYEMKLSTFNVLGLLFIKHFFGIIFLGILYMIIYTCIKKHKKVISTLFILFYLVSNIIWNLHVVCPFLSISVRSVYLYKKEMGILRFLFMDNIPTVISMSVFYIIIILRAQKLEFVE